MSRLTQCAGILAAAAVLAGCQTVGIPWKTIPREASHVAFVGDPRPEIIYTEVLESRASVRHERIFLLTDTYTRYRSRIQVTMSDAPFEQGKADWIHSPEALRNLASNSRCDDAVLSPVAEGSNANGPFLYLTCHRRYGDHCVLAAQEIRGRRFAMVEWLLCTLQDQSTENLAKFDSLRIRGEGQ